jgi:hypothetical protein
MQPSGRQHFDKTGDWRNATQSGPLARTGSLIASSNAAGTKRPAKDDPLYTFDPRELDAWALPPLQRPRLTAAPAVNTHAARATAAAKSAADSTAAAGEPVTYTPAIIRQAYKLSDAQLKLVEAASAQLAGQSDGGIGRTHAGAGADTTSKPVLSPDEAALAEAAALRTGEQAIAFFMRHGPSCPVKFVYLKRALAPGDAFRPYDLRVVPASEISQA